jgi:uncharacterized membrane protein
MDNTATAALFGAVGAVLGAGLTTLGSYLNGKVAAKTTERQIRAAAQEAEAARAAAVEDGWRRKRHQTYTELIGLVPAVITGRDPENMQRVRQALAAAELVGSEAVAESAATLFKVMNEYEMSDFLAKADPEDKARDAERLQLWLRLGEATKDFRQRARVDLGTEH